MARGVTWLAALALAAPACSHQRTAEFELYPEAEVAAARSPHEFRGRPLCQSCHARGDGLRTEPVALCRRCHLQHGGNHPVDVVQKAGAGRLPLWQGKVACHSCHDPHDVKALPGGLRAPGSALCLECNPAR